mmetsp:Transcript_1254/g.3779  ORF Transcript_1254/g.3779 Transcript_1254/m.3779 type:complete len:464 (-) Transcript_1254:22-1413(-)|eukprot:CAMPEP_0119259228 /NCGR_PEP_ID=MMETSP1329-20130426/127_1 /TAXON_ID=114041 /ORGANISM="Genus nov. species nov., Strain RCC1024" /LENGTH=463 /DNA_ID=CAMNT_0007258593 /DNA_START=111 /DNA_END=1502 /DNA_ORIENTATION=+
MKSHLTLAVITCAAALKRTSLTPKRTSLPPARQFVPDPNTRAFVGEGRRYPTERLLTFDEERLLGKQCRRLVALRDSRAQLVARLGREPSAEEWAFAVGYDSAKALKRDKWQMQTCRDELIRRNRGLVRSVVNKYPPVVGLSFYDLFQEGSFGLAQAVDRFDPDKGFRFSTYAVWWIRQAISHAINHQGRTIRLPTHVHDTLREIKRYRERVVNDRGFDATDAELSAHLGKDVGKIRRIRKAALEVASTDHAFLADAKTKGGEPAPSATVREILADTTQKPAEAADRLFLREKLDEVMEEALEGREREVVTAHFGLNGEKPLSYLEIAEGYALSKERVRQIERSALYKLRQPQRQRLLKAHTDFPVDETHAESVARKRREQEAKGQPVCRCRDVGAGHRLTEVDSDRVALVEEVKKGGWLLVRYDDAPEDAVFVRPSVFLRPEVITGTKETRAPRKFRNMTLV